MNFRVGQKVVCVDAAIPAHRKCLHRAQLVERAIYTVRAYVKDFDGEAGVLVDEIISEISYFGEEYGFHASRFRPLVEKKTDAGMAIRKSILEDTENYKVIENA